MHSRHLLPLLALILAGCDQIGIESSATREAEGKAMGGACRHAGRALEDCYILNPKASRAAIFTGWREFDAYMRENKLEVVVPVVPRPDPEADKKAKEKTKKKGKGEKGEKGESKGEAVEGEKPPEGEKAAPPPAHG